MDKPDPFFIPLDCGRLEGIVFEGFPYLIVHPTLGLNPIILLPRGLEEQSTQWIAQQQRNANRLPVSLVLSADRIIVYQPGGAQFESSRIFVPGFPVSGKIEACVSFYKGGELAERTHALKEFVAEHNPGGYLVGNPRKGGRVATLEEAQWLFGWVMTASRAVWSAARHAATGKESVSIPVYRNNGGRTSSSRCPAPARTGTAARAATRRSRPTDSTQTTTLQPPGRPSLVPPRLLWLEPSLSTLLLTRKIPEEHQSLGC